MDTDVEALPQRIGVVATDPLRILGLRAVLDQEPVNGLGGVEVVPLSAPRALSTRGLAVVLVDADATPFLLELLASFRRMRPELRLIVLGASSEFKYIERIIGAGAKGYLSHSASEAELRMAMAVVEDGSVWAPRKVMAQLVGEARAAKLTPKFTARETEVLLLLVDGCSNKQIGRSLGIDEVTVKAHVGRLMRKVGVNNRTALTVHALSRSSVESDRG